MRVKGLWSKTWQVEQKPGGREREWATLGVHPLSWLLSNNRLEKVPFVSVPHTSSNRLLLSNQDKGCTPSVAHSLPLPLGPALLNLWTVIMFMRWKGIILISFPYKFLRAVKLARYQSLGWTHRVSKYRLGLNHMLFRIFWPICGKG